MIDKASTPDVVRLSQTKPAGSEGAPPAATAGVPRPPRRFTRPAPAVRPPSLARFPGLLCPQSHIDNGGVAL